ncbi:MAG: LLM class flavin-dependent oxidoreductase, partial [Cyclobacteriaceae bacterium]
MGIEEIARQQNFLESGGNSLMGMQVISLIRKSLECNISIGEFLTNPTVEGVTAYIEKNQGVTKIDRVKRIRRGQDNVASVVESIGSQEENSRAKKKKKHLMEFSLIFFSGDENNFPNDRYKLVMQGAQFADKNDFDAVWIPERHFNKFGGLYPNPSVLAAAIVSSTKNVHVRGGSVVAPLHHPV